MFLIDIEIPQLVDFQVLNKIFNFGIIFNLMQKSIDFYHKMSDN